MATAQDLMNFFTNGINTMPERTVGIEVETHFTDESGQPATINAMQNAFSHLAQIGWEAVNRKGGLITELCRDGWRLGFELGRQNIELASPPLSAEVIVQLSRQNLEELYEAMAAAGLGPIFKPVIETNDDLLIIPDRRDEVWARIDGREHLNLLAGCASTQFTIAVSPDQAMDVVNRLNAEVDLFLVNYLQDEYWLRYVAGSLAGYASTRYGKQSHFGSLQVYCERLSRQSYVSQEQERLIPFAYISPSESNISLFLRSVWWHFRLKRYGDTLCVEVRPQPRLTDDMLPGQLQKVLIAAGLA